MDLFHDQREDLFPSNLAERRNEVGIETLANENFLNDDVVHLDQLTIDKGMN